MFRPSPGFDALGYADTGAPNSPCSASMLWPTSAPLHRPAAAYRAGLRRRSSSGVGRLHGLLVRPESQGHAHGQFRFRSGLLRRQVLTTRNVRGHRITDFLLGGLNYQIEHHLFPNMPRDNLRAAQPIVRAYCENLDIPYTEASLLSSYRQALHYLHSIGQPLRDPVARTQPEAII